MTWTLVAQLAAITVMVIILILFTAAAINLMLDGRAKRDIERHRAGIKSEGWKRPD